MWSKITGKSDASSHDSRRKEHGSSSSRRRAESIVSSATSRNPSSRVEDRSDYPPTLSSRSASYPPPPSVSSIGTFATARDYDLRSERTAPSRSGLDDDDLRSVRSEKRRDDDSRSTRSERHRDDDLRSERSERRRDRSSSRDRKRDRKEGDREHKKKDKKDSKDSKDKRDKDKDESGKKSKTRTRSGSKLSEIVDEPARPRAGDISAHGTGAYELPMASPSISQYGSQYGAPNTVQTPHDYERMDAHVANQFPGQTPTQFSAPYRPPLNAQSEAGLASDYYGDQGQSVHYQPGIRPDVVVGAEPHLMSASAVANPPAETGHGAAADYYGISSQTSATNGERPPTKPPRPQSMPGSFVEEPPAKPPRPQEKYGKTSTAAAAAGGAALGYALGHDSSSSHHGSSSHHTSSVHQSSNSTSFYQQGSSHQVGDSYVYAPASTAGTTTYTHATSEPVLGGYAQSTTSKPSKLGKHSSHSNAGLYAAGAAGLAAGAYGLHEHHAHHQHSSVPQNGAYYPSQPPSYSGLGMGMQHRQRGPVDKLVDWWKDYEDVRKMEEYTEYIGVCRHCFDPNEPPTMAPRKHHSHPHRRSSGSLRHSRVNKESRYRYSSSDDEKKSKSHSWVAKGLAGYGIAKVGKALWWQNQDFDDTYSAKSGRRHRSSRSSLGARSRSRSRDRRSVASDRRSVTSRGVVRQRSRSRDSRMSRGYTSEKRDYKVVHRYSESRSRSRDRKSGLFTAAAGAALGAGVAGASVRHRSRSRSKSPRPGYVVRRPHTEEPSGSSSFFGVGEKDHRHSSRHSVVSSASHNDDRRSHRSSREPTGSVLGGIFSSGPPSTKRHKTHAKKKKGFFNFGNSSSSSSDSGLAFGGSTLSRRSSTLSRRGSGRKKRRDSDEKLNAALVGLGATAAALAVAQGRDKHQGKRKPEVVAVRENRARLNGARHSSDRTRMPGSFVGSSSDEEGWESASDDESDTSSLDSGLAFGDFGPRSRKSVESLRSDASGTNKWNWRWGSKKERQKRKSQDSLRAGAGLAGAGLLGAAADNGRSSASSVPTLQTVYPVATSDPTAFDAVRRSASITSQQQGQYGQPLMTSRPEPVPLQQPQPVMPVSNAVYTTQAAYAPTPAYTAPSGPPVFSATTGSKAPTTTFPGHPGHSEFEQRPPMPPRRGNSSPTLSSTKHDSTKRDLAIAGVAAAATAGVIAATHSGSSSTASKRRTSSPTRSTSSKRVSSPSSVRFELTKDQKAKDDKERRKDLKRKEDERADRGREREREREREFQREREREIERERELETQREYERMRRVEEEARLQERRQQEQAEREAAARREAEAAQARERARQEAEDKANLDRETERILRERAEAAQAAAARELAAREEMERRRLDHENATRERERLEREIYEQEFNRKREEDEAAKRQKEREEKLDYDIESRHRQLRERERDIVEPEEHSWKTPAVAAAAGIAAGAAVAGIAHSSKDNPFDDKHAHGDSRSSKIEYDDDHLYEDEIMDPNYFNKKDSSRTPSREREQGIARNAAKKVIEDMEKRYKDDRKQSAAEFFAPPELLDRSTPSKIDYGPDADVQVYHSPYVVTVQPPYDPQYSFTATKDGYDHKINKFGGVPTLNLIEPTPPVSLAGSTRDEHSRSPSPAIPSHTDDSGSPKSTRASERDKEREREEKQRKRTSVTWGADETFHYEAQTPESFREHYMSEHDMKRHLPDDWVHQGNQSYADQHSYQGNDEIVVERDSPRSGKERVSYRPEPEERNRGWGPETESPVEEIKRFEDDGRQVIDSTSPEHTPTIVTPSEEQAKLYHSPFFESVSDFQAYDVSPGAEAERQRGQRGYVEGEIVEEPEEIVASKPRETEPHMPGGWDDDEPQREAESAWAEPKLSKKEQKKREKASKRASLDAQAEAARLAEDVASSTGSLRDLDKEARREPEPKVEEPAWEPPLTKKEKKKREKEAARRASLEAEAAAVARVESPREEPVVQPEAEWEAPLSKKEQKKRDKAAKRASLDRQDSSSLPSTPAEEPKAEDLWEDAPSSKKDKRKKKRDSVDRDPRDIEPSFAYPSPPGEKDRESSRDAKSGYGVPPSRMPDVSDDKSRRRSMDAGNHSSSAVPLSFAAATSILAGGLSDSKRKEPKVDPLYAATSPSHQMPRAPSPPSTPAPYPDYSNGHHASGAPYPPAWPSAYSQAESPARSIPSTAFHDYDELADAKQPSKKSKRRSRLGTGSAGPGSPLRTELAFDDYIGMDAAAAAAAATAGRGLSKTSSESFDAANVPLPENESPPFSPSGDKSSKGKKHYVYDEPEEFPISTGIDLPTDPYGPPNPLDEARHSPDQEEDRSKYYPERGYAWEEEGERKKHRHHHRHGSEDRDTRSVASDERDSEGRRKHRHHRRRESERSDNTHDDTRSIVSGESYDADGHRKHKHRKHRSTGDDDTRSVVSEFRDDEEDERRKHKHRRSKRESEIFDDSLRDRDARSEPGDILDREDPERRKHKRRSKREGDFDDTASVVSSPAKYYEDDKKKDKEKEKKGILSSIFGRSKESLVDTSSSKSHDKSRDDDDGEEHKHRRRKHRSSTHGSSYGSDDDSRSVVSASGRREKRHSSSRDDSGMDYSRHYKVHTTSSERLSTSSRRLPDDFSAPIFSLDDSHPLSFNNVDTASAIDDNENHLLNDSVYSKDDTTIGTNLDNGSKRHSYNGESFLGHRARGSEERMPPLPTTNVQVSPAHFEHHDELEEAVPIFTALPRSRSNSPTEVGSAADLPALPGSRPGSPDITSTPNLLTKDKRSTPSLQNMRKTSATAVPLSFRGFGSPRVGSDVGTTTPSGRPASSTSIPIPFLAHHGRRASTGAHTPAATPSRSPVSPQHPPATDPSASSSSTWTPPLPAPSLTTSPVRHKKVPSTEFKGGTFRPLYLVERNASRRRGSAPNADAEPELLPMLPSSRSPSVSQDSSEEWASAVEDNNDDDDSFASAGASGYASATEGVEEQPRDLRNAGLRIDTGASMAQADLLDSQQSTPRAGAFGLGVKDQGVDVPARAAERLVEVEREEKEREQEKERGMSVGEMAAAAVVGGAVGLAAREALKRRDDKDDRAFTPDGEHEVVLPTAVEEPVEKQVATAPLALTDEHTMRGEERGLSVEPAPQALGHDHSIPTSTPIGTEESPRSAAFEEPTSATPAVEELSTTPTTAIEEPISTSLPAPAEEPTSNILDDFMGGEPDNDAIEEARLAAEAEERQRELEQDGPSTPTRPALLSRTSSKKSKKAKKKAEKLGTVSPPEGGEATELSREEVREKTRRDTEEAIEGWFVDEPAEAAPPLKEELPMKTEDEKAEPVAVAAEVPSVLLERKGSKKKTKKGKKSKSGSVSELATPTEVSADSSGEVAVPETQSQAKEAAPPSRPRAPAPDLSDEVRQSAVQEAELASTTEQTVERAPVTFEEDATPQVAELALETVQDPVSVIPEADPEAEFAPVTSSKKKKKDKKGKSGSMSEVVAPAEPAAPVVEEGPLDVGPESENRAGLEATIPEQVQSQDGDREIEIDTQHVPPSDEVEKGFTAEPSTEPITTLEEDTTPRTITEQTPVFKGETIQEPAPLVTDADPEAEFAPVVSSKKKKKGKKGKKSGSGSGSGFATPVEEAVAPVDAVDEAKSVEPAITHEVDQPADSSVLGDSKNVLAPENFVDTHGFETPTAKETADIETPTVVATDVPVVPVVDELGVHGVLEEGADVGTVQPADHQEQQPAHQPFIDPSTNLEEPATVSEEPASLGLTSVETPTETPEADPEAEFVAVPAKKKKKGKKGRTSVSESPPDESLPGVSNVTETSREIEERPAITETPTEVVSEQPVVADTPAHIMPEVSTIAEQDQSSLAAAVPLPNLEDDLGLAKPEAEQHFDFPKQTDVPEQFVAPEQTNAKTLEADPEDEFSVVPSKKKKKSKGKNKQQQDEIASETTAPVLVEEVQEKHHVTADAVPLLEGRDGNLVEQDASAAVPMAEDERQEFKEAEEAMKIEPEAFVQEKEELATDKAPEPVLPAAASETVPELSNEPQSPVARDEVREPSVALPEETITTATVPDAQPEEDTWAFQPKKRKGKKGKKAKSGQSSVDFTEPSTPAEPIAAAPELSRDAGVPETTDFSSAPKVPSAEVMETALSTGDLPETTMAFAGHPAGEGVEREMPVAEILPDQDRSIMEEATNTEEPTHIPHLDQTEDVISNLRGPDFEETKPILESSNTGEGLVSTLKSSTAEEEAPISQPSATEEPNLSSETFVPQQSRDISLEEPQQPVEPEVLKDAFSGQSVLPVEAIASSAPEAQPEDEWAVPGKGKKKGKKKKRASMTQSPAQVESPAPGSPKLQALTTKDIAVVAPSTQEEPAITVDLTQPAAENFNDTREITSAATDQPANVTDDLRGSATPAADPTAAVSEENPSNPAADESREETPPYAGEWELPTQKKKAGKKGKKRGGSTGQDHLQVEEGVPTDAQIASSASLLPDDAAAVPVPDVVDAADARTEDPVASSAHHRPLTPPPQSALAEDTPASGLEHSLEQQREEPLQIAEQPLVEEQQVEQQVEQPVATETAVAEDEWSFMPPKKNKKGKKGKKQDSTSSTPKEIEQAPETIVDPTTDSHAIETVEPELPQVETPAEELAIASTGLADPIAPVEAGEDEWAIPAKKKKKGKKGKKGFADVVGEAVQAKEPSTIPSAQDMPEHPLESDVKIDDDNTSKSLDVPDVPGQEVSQDLSEDRPVGAAEAPDVAVPVPEESSSREAPEAGQVTETVPVNDVVAEEKAPIEPIPEQAKDADADDIWAVPTTKKSKKKKKGKQMSVEEPSTPVETIEPAVAGEEVSAPPVEGSQEIDPVVEAPAEVVSETQPEIVSESQPEPSLESAPADAGETNAEDEWAAASSSKKKKKKGKKGKQDSISETPPNEERKVDEEQTPETGRQVDVEPVAGELVEPTVDQVPVLDEPVKTPVVEEPASAPVVEEARAIEEPAETPIVAEPVVTEVSSVDTPQEAGEDEWALPAKKKKKGKKGKQASIPSTPPVIEEPVPVVEEPVLTTEEPVPKVEDIQDDKLQLTEEPKSLGDSEELKDIPTAVELVKEEISLPIESEAQRNVEEIPATTEPAAEEIPVLEDVPAVQQAPEEAKPDDTWEAFSSKKKGKKGKKGKQQSISTPPVEISETQQELDPANGTQRELLVEDTPREEQIAPTEADPTEEFSMPMSKKDKKKKKKAAAAAAQLDDTPVAETSSTADETPAQATPIVEDSPRPEAERERSKPAFSFADAAGVLAAGVADSRGKEAEPEGLSATPISSSKIENDGAKGEEVLRPDPTAVETELPGVPKEPSFDSTAGDVAVAETVVQSVSIADSAKDILAPSSTELTREFPESKGKSTASVPKSLGFAAAAGILADIVAEDRRKESSSEGLRSDEPDFATPKEDIPSSLDMTATNSVQPDPVQETSTTETPASQDKDISATIQEISTEQPISDVPVESTTSIPVETPGDVNTTPPKASQAPEETDPFSEFAPVKKGKKNKKKGRKSVGTATPTTEEPVPELKEVTAEPTIEADAAPVAEETVADAKAIESDARPQEQTKEAVELASATDEKRSESPSHDVEFAATLAAGLQDSGFDPNLVLKDPTFHERKSPPGSVLEADPDDVFAPAKSKKNKKKKKGLATPDVEGESSEIVTPEPGSVEATSQDPTFAAAMSSVLDDPTFNRRTPSPDAAKEAVSDEFFPFQKRPKKKKGKKSQDISPDSETVDQTLPEGIEEPTPIMDTPQEAASGSYFDPQPTTSMEEPVSTTEQTPMEIDVPRDITAEDSQPPQEEEDAWSFGPTKKKGKKGKKGKKATLFEEEQEPPVPADESSRSAAVDSPVVEAPTDVPTAVENPVAAETGVEDVQARDGGDSLETNAAEKGNVQDEHVAAVAEDEWAVPTRKKSKKGKKGKKGAKADVQDEPGQQTPVEEVAAPAPVSTSWADQMEDEPAVEVPTEPGSLVRMLEQPSGEVAKDPSKEEGPVDGGWDFPWQKKEKETKRMSVQEMAEKAAMPDDDKAADITMEEHQPHMENASEAMAIQEPQAAVPEISTIHEPPKHQDPSPTESQSSKIAGLFPGLERVKRKVPPPKHAESSTVDYPLRKSSHSPLSSERGIQEPSRKSSRSPLHTESNAQQDKGVTAEQSTAPSGLAAVMQPTWGFPPDPPNRDSAVTMNDTPVIPSDPVFHDTVRDSGYHDNDSPRTPIEDEQQISPPEPMRVDVETGPGWETSVGQGQSSESVARDYNDNILPSETPAEQISPPLPDANTVEGTTYTSPVESLTTTRARSSQLFRSSPSAGSVLDTPFKQFDTPEPSRSMPSSPPTAAREMQQETQQETPASIFGDPTQQTADRPQPSTTPSRHLRSPSVPLDTIREYSPDDSPLSKKGRPLSDVGMPDHGVKSLRRSFGSGKSLRDQAQSSAGHPEEDQGTVVNIKNPSHVFRQTEKDSGRQRAGSIGDPFVDKPRSPSIISDRSGSHTESIFARIKTPEHIRPPSSISNRSATPPLRRVDRAVSGDLRAASQLAEAKTRAKSPATSATVRSPTRAGPSTYDRVRDKGKARAPDMSDSYEGWGDAPGTPLSPTRPPSVRKRQSLHIMDLETRLDQLASENRLLQEAKARAEEAMQDASVNRDAQDREVTVAVEARDAQIRAKDAEIAQISEMLHNLRQEIARLTEVNATLSEANRNLTNDTNSRYATLQAETQSAQQRWQESERQLEHLRAQHNTLSAGMGEVVREEIKIALKDKDAEIRRLHDELADATEQVKSLQRQILDSKQGDSFLTVRDEDYFDSACQQLCQHVQQWVLRFSKFSDTRACRLSSDVKNDKIETRLDNAILDGTDVDMLLADRVRRRDVFMSVVMTMIWEYVFTRYLFGMDREQRQKLKALEKTLTDVGPPRAVAQWRAITLTLLSKREHFERQRTQDTEAVVQEIYSTLTSLLPPPSHLADKIQESLRNVLRLAVNLSIEMRTQRSEYIMLPPLQPEYDTNGDLVRKVYFNAALMNERSGETTSNEELEAARAVVKIVLFPLVVKKGDDLGEGEDEIVVCPAQVLTAKPAKDRKVVRVLSGAMEFGDADRRSMRSRSSLSRMPPGQVGSPMPMPEGSAMDTTF